MSKSYLVEVEDGVDYNRRKVGADMGRRKMGGDYSDDDIYGTLGRTWQTSKLIHLVTSDFVQNFLETQPK